MNQEREKKSESRPEEKKNKKMRQPYFDSSIPEHPIMLDEDTAVNAQNMNEK